MIIENECLDEIQKIWSNNNKGYISYECNQRSINDEDMLKIVYKEEGIVNGYAVLYFGKDFCELEGYPNKIIDTPDKVAYVWEIVTDIKYLRKGVASSILNYIKTRYKGYSLYSCIELSNIPSFKLHTKIGFSTIYEFKEDDGCEYAMMEAKL